MSCGVTCHPHGWILVRYSNRESTRAGITDSAAINQTESGMTDSSGHSTLGSDADKTRADQGQPVTSKGDTVNPSVDSSTAAR